MLTHKQARADARALVGAVAIGSAMGLALGGAYLAGGAARAALSHAHSLRLAAAAADGFSESALRSETAAMDPGAIAIARRHDPFIALGSAQRDRETTLFAAKLVERPPAQTGSNPLLLKVSLTHVAPTPAAPFSLGGGDALTGARELDCLSAAVYYEARGESAEGQAAVAQVVLNRVRHAGFPKTVCGVVFQGAPIHSCQFSFACDGSMHRGKEEGAWRRAQTVATRALSGFVLAQIGDATHFHVASLGGIWGGNLIKVAQIGTHVFYRLVGGGRGASIVRSAPDLYTPATSAVDKADAAKPAADGGGDAPNLILASAVTKLGEGGPAVVDAASASVVTAKPATGGKAAEKAIAAPTDTVKATS